MRVTLSTNGILLHKNMHIVELADDIGIPLDGNTPESSEIMRKGSKKSFVRVIDNIKRIQDEYPEKDFTIRTVVTNQNKEIIIDIGNFLLQQGILSPTVRWKIYECSSYGPRTEEIRNGKRKMSEFEFEEITGKIKNNFPNQRLFFQKQKASIGRYIIINPDGNIKIIEGDGVESFVGHISHIEQVLLDNNFINNMNHG